MSLPFYLNSEIMQALIQQLKSLLKNGQFGQVIQQVDEQLSVGLKEDKSPVNDNDYVELLYFKALAQRYSTNIDGALTTLQQLHNTNPSHARGYQELGYCFIAKAQPEKASKAFATATSLNPALLSAWQQQLPLLPDSQTIQKQRIQEQLSKLQSLPKPLLGTLDLMHEGKLAVAENICRKFLQEHKHHPDGMCLLAEIGVRTKVYDDALFLLETCVSLYPDFLPAQTQLVELYCKLGLFHEAAPLAQKYLDQQPDNLMVKSALASAYIGLGQVLAARDVYQQILALEPHRAGINVQLGHALKYAGDYDAAVAAYQQAYTLKPTYGDAYWSLANTKSYRFSDDEIARLQVLIDDNKVTIEDRTHALFALGRAFEDKRKFARSFAYYQRGNKLKSSQISYDAALTTHLMELQKQHCTAKLFESIPSASNKHTPTPIFIVGLPRAGSTLLEQILASHSQVEATNELHIILSFALKLRGRMTNKNPSYPANLSTLDEIQLRQLGDQYLSQSAAYRTGKPYFIDKMPNNFVHIGLIKKILPQAIIIDARREPLACCFSGYKQLFGEGQEFSYDLVTIGQYYQDYVSLMEHWDAVLPGHILRVQHEDILTDLQGQVERLLAFCGLPYEPQCIDFYRNKRSVVTPSSEQVRQPINTKSKDVWRNYAEFLVPLLVRFSENSE